MKIPQEVKIVVYFSALREWQKKSHELYSSYTLSSYVKETKDNHLTTPIITPYAVLC